MGDGRTLRWLALGMWVGLSARMSHAPEIPSPQRDPNGILQGLEKKQLTFIIDVSIMMFASLALSRVCQNMSKIACVPRRYPIL